MGELRGEVACTRHSLSTVKTYKSGTLTFGPSPLSKARCGKEKSLHVSASSAVNARDGLINFEAIFICTGLHQIVGT
jgi:hypothetical protein